MNKELQNVIRFIKEHVFDFEPLYKVSIKYKKEESLIQVLLGAHAYLRSRDMDNPDEHFAKLSSDFLKAFTKFIMCSSPNPDVEKYKQAGILVPEKYQGEPVVVEVILYLNDNSLFGQPETIARDTLFPIIDPTYLLELKKYIENGAKNAE